MSQPVPYLPEGGARRRSFLDIGGPNSLNNFASSLQRAQTHLEVTLPETSGMADLSPCTSNNFEEDEESALEASHSKLGPFGQALGYGSTPSTSKPGVSHTGNSSISDLNSFQFPGEPEYPQCREHENNRTSRGSRTSRTSRTSRSSHVSEREGRSTMPQTIFNAVNTLMGIAMLSLPFGFRLAGWIPGTLILLASGWLTAQTAKILGALLKKNPSMNTYADIAYHYGGQRFLAAATLVFSVDMIGALLSLVLIFSDSFVTLFPTVPSYVFKIAITAITFFLSFMPLSLVSLVSLVGIVSTIGIFAVIALCGLTTSAVPGSLLHPAATKLWPTSATEFFLSLGIFMAPWGGHPVFPELYRDMRHPAKYAKSCNITFLATILLDLLVAVVGYLMFGDSASDSITKNIIASSQYPDWIRSLICLFLGLLPVCKLALVSRPVVSVYESQLGLVDRRSRKVSVRQIVARAAFMAFLFVLSMAFTSFGNVVAFLGSAICFTICVTLPLLFHLKLNAEELTPFLELATKVGIAVGIIGAILGTYASFASTG